MKIVIFNLGCKVNQYESDAILCRLAKDGHEVSEKLEKADAYILNTCAVTAEAEKKSRQAIARVKKLNPNADIYVCGCASEHNLGQFDKSGVVFIGGTAGKDRVCDLISQKEILPIPRQYEEIGFASSPRTRSYIKIQDGCNNFCSYCIIPYVRGRSRSRSPENVAAEVENAQSMTLEVVLTGINLSAYGLDIGTNLAELLKKLASYDVRIRLGSIEASVISEDFLSACSNLKNFCPHFHLSLQSGDNRVLRAMNRHYTTEQYYDKVLLIGKYFPDAAITTDIIAGFPTETEQEFLNTLEFANKVGFADIHVFEYSERAGTVAAKMQQLSSEVKAERAKLLDNVKRNNALKFNSRFIGKPLEVLFEEKTREGLYSGYSRNYIRVYTKTKIINKKAIVIPDDIFNSGLITKEIL